MLMTKNRRLRQIVGLVETGNLLLLKLMLQRNAQARIYPNTVFAEYMHLGGRAPWRSVSIFEFLPELVTERLRVDIEYLPGEGMITRVNELAFMAMATKVAKPKLVFEFGTFRGRTALNFALNSPDDCQVYTLDLPADEAEAAAVTTGNVDASVIRAESRIVGSDYRGTDMAHKITQLYGNSMTFDFSPYHGQADLVFIDGGHEYAIAGLDTDNALRMLRPGGIILWHDFANYGEFHDVTRAVLDRLPHDQVFQIENTWLAGYRKPSG